MQVGVHTALLHWLILCERYVSKRARILLTLIFSRQTATFLEILPYKLISFLKKKKRTCRHRASRGEHEWTCNVPASPKMD